MGDMKAIVVEGYGDVGVLELKQIPQPEPGEGEVLVRVHAVGVNAIDWKIRSGAMQRMMPVSFPWVPGVELAGVVERVGPGVAGFSVGQEVFGRANAGAYAEYCVAPATTLAPKPPSLTFVEAATIPIGASTAWQALFDEGGLQPGQRVLILGGSGGVGMFGVQFAHASGAQVLATTSTSNVEFVRSLGADTVIDYTQTPAVPVEDVDLLFDAVGGATAASAMAALKRGGRFVSIVNPPDGAQAESLGVKASFFSMRASAEQLDTWSQMLERGELRTLVGAVFPLSEAAQAHAQSQRGHGRGRIVLQVV
ncbi:NADP-dependent oxidoreductase [Chloroflexia bacterium SDU3-3]|nr:NADP-dependent oxidoreductase [Chloroflexia bacterium SDU3-3]